MRGLRLNGVSASGQGLRAARRTLLGQVRRTGSAKALAGSDATHSQESLYCANGLPA